MESESSSAGVYCYSGALSFEAVLQSLDNFSAEFCGAVVASAYVALPAGSRSEHEGRCLVCVLV